MKQVRVTANFQVTGGSKLEAAKDFEVQFLDDGEFIVPFSESEKAAESEEAAEYPCEIGSGKNVKFLAIKPKVSSEDYENLKLSYRVYNSKNEASSEEINLTEPHIFIGAGAVSALGEDIETIVFKNKQVSPDDSELSGITVSMMIGRDVSPKSEDAPTGGDQTKQSSAE